MTRFTVWHLEREFALDRWRPEASVGDEAAARGVLAEFREGSAEPWRAVRVDYEKTVEDW